MTVLLAALVITAESSECVSVRADFAQRFHGAYAFRLDSGEDLVLIWVGGNYVASIGTSTRFNRVVELRAGPLVMNVVRDGGVPFVLLQAPLTSPRILMFWADGPRVAHGRWSHK